LYPSTIIVALIFFIKLHFFSRLVFGWSFVILNVLLIGWRILKRIAIRYLLSKGYNNLNVLIIGAGRVGKILYETIKEYSFLGLRVVGFIDDFKKSSESGIPILGKTSDLEEVCKKYFIDELFITIPSERKVVSQIIDTAKYMRIAIRIIPEHFEEPFSLVRAGNIGPIPILTYKERIPHPAEFVLKSFLDFIISFILVILLSPLFFIISILIKLDSPGSVFYIQKRMGKRGKIFNFYKFRSMVKYADKLKGVLLDKNEVKGGVIFKIKDDPRVTRMGRILRKYSLDELPQLFNVLFGDMSLVGPRPFPLDESEKINYNYISRLNIKPGITGLAQIRGRSELSFQRWVKWDLWYIDNWSLGLDLMILLWTIPAVLKRKGAY